jgi:hypothetical protein
MSGAGPRQRQFSPKYDCRDHRPWSSKRPDLLFVALCGDVPRIVVGRGYLEGADLGAAYETLLGGGDFSGPEGVFKSHEISLLGDDEHEKGSSRNNCDRCRRCDRLDSTGVRR